MSIQILLSLDEEQVCALAQFLKRAVYSDYRLLAVGQQEAQDMQAAADKLRMALTEHDIAPRRTCWVNAVKANLMTSRGPGEIRYNKATVSLNI